ncbi:ABC transporter ATP-binding protein [Aureimonas fodinaquatilis]|uniref:Nickel import system ATP-binding protein NikD n=1 Tax=Aureimonas fodinaquatilis TaxID=2565783 RepID=A0A5B0DZP9_9HYPH|nr:ATP-binding cassette domain-containing protein [Aureimonas fodinaquatilis]KAA0972023.1 ABC transporter ATP-binding protein [Aureimonas fodinaquatilis]
MLVIDDLSASFRRYNGLFRQDFITRLSNITLTIQAGEIVALVGHSGAGKSLLAHAILGLLPANAIATGTVSFEGQLLNQHNLVEHRGRNIALLPQQTSYLDPTANVGALVRWAALRGGKPLEIKNRLNRVGLSDDVAQLFPHQLSGGMARRVLMAQATSGGAKLLIADEPTAGLDPANRDIVLKHLRAHADNGGAALLITHDLIPVLSYADRIAMLKDGQLCCVAPTSSFSGTGEMLASPYAKSLWRALPQNDFYAYA